MSAKLSPFTIKCLECNWERLVQPQRELAPDCECPAQACPECGSESTVIEFFHRAEGGA